MKGARYNRSKSGWFDAVTFKDWFEKLFVPHVRRLGQRVMLIGDNLASHFSEGVIRAAEENNIAFVCLPKNSTHLCQPLDVAFYRPLKMKWREILDEWKQRNVTKCCVTKDHLPGLLRKLCLSVCDETEDKLVSQNLVAGFRKCGIVPLSRNEVLSRLPPSSATDSSGSGQLPDTADSADTGAAAAVSSAVLNHLSKMRHGDSEQPQRRKRVRVDVEPGCSISFEDLNNNTLEPAPSTTPKDGSHTDSGNLPTGTRAKKQRLNKTSQQKKRVKRQLNQKGPPTCSDVESSSEDETPVMVETLANNSEDGDPLESAPEPEAGSSTGPDAVPPDTNQQPAHVPISVSVSSFYTKKLCRLAATGLKPAVKSPCSGRKRKASLPARYRL